MAGVRASLAVSFIALLTGSAVAGESAKYRADFRGQMDWEPGTADLGDANVLYAATRTIAASSNEDLDLAGVLADALGSTIAAAEVVAVIIEAAAGNTNDVRFGPAASAGALGPFADATDRIGIRPGNFIVLTCKQGWTITATTADKWNFANSSSGSGVTYTIHILGRTVAA